MVFLGFPIQNGHFPLQNVSSPGRVHRVHTISSVHPIGHRGHRSHELQLREFGVAAAVQLRQDLAAAAALGKTMGVMWFEASEMMGLYRFI